jgi:hypothetical protein
MHRVRLYVVALGAASAPCEYVLALDLPFVPYPGLDLDWSGAELNLTVRRVTWSVDEGEFECACAPSEADGDSLRRLGWRAVE